MRRLFAGMGFEFLIPTTTNQIFVIMEKAYAARLEKYVRFGVWEPFSETHTVYRFASDWATTDSDVATLESALKKAMAQ